MGTTLLKAYLRFAPVSRAIIRSREAELFLELKPEGKIIDLGIGDGHFAELLEEHGVKILVGIDRSIDELLMARRRTKAHLVVADMERLPFRSATFDTAISNCVLEHISDIDAVFFETARVTRRRFLTSVVSDRYEDLLFWPRVFRFVKLDVLARSYLDYIRNRFVHRRYPKPDEWVNLAASYWKCSGLRPYSGARRQAMMDLFLPFVLLGRVWRALFGTEVIVPGRWPARMLNDFLIRDPKENILGESANVFIDLEKK